MRKIEGKIVGVRIYKEKQENFEQRELTSRPKKLACDIHHFVVSGEQWTFFVGLWQGKCYELFGGLSDRVQLPKKYDKGWLIKRERKTTRSIYDLEVEIGDGEKLLLKDVVETFNNPNNSAFTRLISLSLRHGAKPEFLVEQLSKEKDMYSFARVVARVLKKYVPDDTKPMKRTCPDCSQDTLVYEEGCLVCKACGSSKCA